MLKNNTKPTPINQTGEVKMYAGYQEEGDTCPEIGCSGKLYYPKSDNCSCHISPPCHSCTSVVLTCKECGWEKSSHPYDAKKIGRKVKNFNDTLWSAISMTVMYDVNLAKFSHTEILRRCLLETGDRIIVEASPYDKIWGIGLAENDPKALDQSNGRVKII
jgi:hypothetical protein